MRTGLLIAFCIIIGSTLSTFVAFAWTAPTASPPGNNVAPPINVGGTLQLKSGTLGVNGLGVFGDTILSGSGIDGSPPAYLNFGATAGTGGYGIRNNNGTLEFKNINGSWGSLNATLVNLLQVNGITSSGLGQISSIKFNDGTTQTSAASANPWQTGGSYIYYNGGYVSIGTPSAYNPLELYGANTSFGIGGNLSSGQATGIQFQAFGQQHAGLRWANDGTHNLYLEDASLNANPSAWYNPNTVNFIVRNGSVGVGTTQPNDLLHVAGAGSSNAGISIGSPTDSSGGTNQLNFLAWRDVYGGNSNYLGASMYTVRNFICCGGYPSGGYAGVIDTDLAFATRDPGNTALNNKYSDLTERMRITAGGNVGIGTNNPFSTLQVSGNIGEYSPNSTSAGSPVGASIYLGDANYLGGSYYNSAPGLSAVFGAMGVASDLAFYTYTGSANSRSEKMRILSNGNVGINTNSPSSPLTVNGVIQSTSGGVKFPDGTTQTTAAGAGVWTTSGNNIYANNTGNVGIGTTNPTQSLDVSGNANISGGVYTSDWFRITNSNGLYWQNWGGGLYMADASWIRTYNNAGIWAGAAIFSGNVGIGTSNPTSPLTILTSGESSEIEDDIGFYDYTNSAVSIGYVGYRARGTTSSPTPVQAGDVLASYWGHPYTGSAFSTAGAGIFMRAEANATPTSYPSYMTFNTTPSNSSSAYERMRIASDGEVNIVNGLSANSNIGGGSVQLQSSGTNSNQTGYVAWYKPGNTVRLGYLGWDPNNIQLNLENGATFSVTGGQMIVYSSVTATAFNQSSDARLKTNIQTFPDALQVVNQLRGVTFNWKKDGIPSAGVIAQEVEKVLPSAVTTDSKTGMKSVEYSQLMAPMIEAIKEQQNQIDAQTKKTDAQAQETDTQKLCISSGTTQTCITQQQLAALLASHTTCTGSN